MLNVITHPNKTLREKSQEVTDILSAEIQKLIPEMMETMLKKDGVGLAAPQVGENIRMLVIKHKDKNLIIFNPEIIKKSIWKEWGEEGCLSVPDKYGDVRRHRKITLKFKNQNNEEKKLCARGFLARIIQHEIDHLDGILFIDKAKNIHEVN